MYSIGCQISLFWPVFKAIWIREWKMNERTKYTEVKGGRKCTSLRVPGDNLWCSFSGTIHLTLWDRVSQWSGVHSAGMVTSEWQASEPMILLSAFLPSCGGYKHIIAGLNFKILFIIAMRREYLHPLHRYGAHIAHLSPAVNSQNGIHFTTNYFLKFERPLFSQCFFS